MPFAFCVLSLSLMYMTNAWDFPIYLLLFGITLLGTNFVLFFETKKTPPKFSQFPLLWPIVKTALPLLGVVILWFLFTLPFNLNFTQIPQGIGLVHPHPHLPIFYPLGGIAVFLPCF